MPKPSLARNNPISFVEQRIAPDLNTGCWLWTGSMCSDGYGYVQVTKSKKVRAHRFSKEHYDGVTIGDLIVRHKCDTPACVNPAHLELGTHADNIADCIARGRKKVVRGHRFKLPLGSRSGEKHNQYGKRKTHCKNGHAFTAENTGTASNGSQRCRACERARALLAYHQKRSAS